MEYVKVIALKFIISFSILYLILGIAFDTVLGNVFLITLVLSIVSFAIGDLLILPRTNNTVATVADFFFGFVVIYLMSAALSTGLNLFIPALFSAIVIAVFEMMFHKYAADQLDFDDSMDQSRTGAVNLGTESSEELFPYKDNDDS
ncbi:YndM family protein [Halobacillus salinarum]|uniref:YndM family protein n=1 Tax=Halobacillus salinarum TaxID=2932257 RepID=A0ABY4EI89_9BACI|nr:DUF2512 family protein [Halobacillus salinarum]UOQ44185.1 YndM family protein [Halobacillus salinarum]